MRKTIRLFILLLCLPAAWVHAGFTATVDRITISENDTLTLTLRSTDKEVDDGVDLSLLRRNFSIINTQRSSKISFVNGKRSSSYDLILTLAPEGTGVLTIPAFSFNGETSTPIAITVKQGSTTIPGQLSEIFLDNQVNKQEVYVQEQILYILKIYHSVGLNDANLSPLEIQNAVVKQLGDERQYETQFKGIRYAVIEINYAIFPQSSGRLTIPVQTLTARTATRPSFSFQTYGKLRRIHSPTQVINVLAKPESYPANTPWLPTSKLDIIDSWQDSKPALTAGEAVTRSVRLRADGLSAAQLPELSTAIDQVKNYPEKAQIDDEISASGITGQKIQATAYVPQAAGTLQVPEMTVYWWNTTTDQLAKSTLPATELTVNPAAETSRAEPYLPELQSPLSDPGQPLLESSPNGITWLWPSLTGLFALLWLLTIMLWWHSNRSIHGGSHSPSPVSNRPSKATLTSTEKMLQRACQDNNPSSTRRTLIQWFKLKFEDSLITDLKDIRALNVSSALNSEIDQLEASLYGFSDAASWQGASLLNALNSLKEQLKSRTEKKASENLKPLYPL